MGIRIGKIMLALALLVSFAREAFIMWRETRDPGSLVMVLFISMALIASLLWSAFKRRDPQVPPKRGWRAFWIVIGWFCGLSVLGQLILLIGPRTNKHVIEVNNMQIPLDECINGSIGLTKDTAERMAFCTCMATALSNYDTLTAPQLRALEKGHIFQLAEDLKTNPAFDRAQFATCMVHLQGSRWTAIMKESAKEECLRLFTVEGTDAQYNAEKYCDCYVSKITSYPPAQVAAWQSDTTSTLYDIQRVCAEMSAK